jgi:hypothetical protein
MIVTRGLGTGQLIITRGYGSSAVAILAIPISIFKRELVRIFKHVAVIRNFKRGRVE